MPTLYAPPLSYADADVAVAPHRTALRIVVGLLGDMARAGWIVLRQLVGFVAPLVLMLAYTVMFAGWIVWAATFVVGRLMQWSVNYGPGLAGGFGRAAMLPVAALRARRVPMAAIAE